MKPDEMIKKTVSKIAKQSELSGKDGLPYTWLHEVVVDFGVDFANYHINNGEEKHDILSRLSRKVTRGESMNAKLRKYAQHFDNCDYVNYGQGKCTCGLEELLNPKRQNPV